MSAFSAENQARITAAVDWSKGIAGQLFSFEEGNQNIVQWRNWGRAVGEALGSAGSFLMDLPSKFVEWHAAMNNFGRDVGTAITSGLELAGIIARTLPRIFAEIGRNVTTRLAEIAADVGAFALSLPAKFEAITGRVAEAGRAMIQALWDGMAAAASGLVDWARNLASSIAEAFSGTFGRIMSGIRGITGGSPVPSGTAAPATVPFGGPRKRGGPVSPGKVYLTGEAGAELFTPGKPGYISNHRQTKAMLSGAGAAMSVVNNIKPTIIVNGAQSPAQVAQAVGQRLEHLLGRSKQLSLEGRTVFE